MLGKQLQRKLCLDTSFVVSGATKFSCSLDLDTSWIKWSYWDSNPTEKGLSIEIEVTCWKCWASDTAEVWALTQNQTAWADEAVIPPPKHTPKHTHTSPQEKKRRRKKQKYFSSISLSSFLRWEPVQQSDHWHQTSIPLQNQFPCLYNQSLDIKLLKKVSDDPVSESGCDISPVRNYLAKIS